MSPEINIKLIINARTEKEIHKVVGELLKTKGIVGLIIYKTPKNPVNKALQISGTLREEFKPTKITMGNEDEIV